METTLFIAVITFLSVSTWKNMYVTTVEVVVVVVVAFTVVVVLVPVVDYSEGELKVKEDLMKENPLCERKIVEIFTLLIFARPNMLHTSPSVVLVYSILVRELQ
jgi:hypothetical protein